MTKLCINCRWHRKHGFSGIDYCDSPNVGIDLVTGKINSQFAVSMRMNFTRIESCRTDAQWFEPKFITNPPKDRRVDLNVLEPERELISIKLTPWQKLKGLFE